MTLHPELTLAEATEMVSYIMTYRPDGKPDIKKAPSLKKRQSASENEKESIPGDGHSLETVYPTDPTQKLEKQRSLGVKF